MEREQAQSRFPVPDLSSLHGHPGPLLSQRHRRKPPATALWFAHRGNGVGTELPKATATETISMHYQFLVDSAKMANTGVAQRECASTDRAFERLVARVGLPVPDNVDGGHKRSRQDHLSRWAPLQQPILSKAHPTVLARISLVQPLFRHPVNKRHNYPSKSRQKVDCPTHKKYVRAQKGNWQEGTSTSQELPVFHIYVLFHFIFIFLHLHISGAGGSRKSW